MKVEYSLAIETSSRVGGLAVGRGDELIATLDFDASARHATQLISRMDQILKGVNLAPADLSHIYVCAGPGSFTGLRVGITVARTLAQAIGSARCVAVPADLAIAQNVKNLAWSRLAVIFDAQEGCIYASLLAKDGERIVPAAPPTLTTPGEFLAGVARPILLTGEGLNYYDMSGERIELVDASLRPPNARGVWTVGRQMAKTEQFTEYNHLLPIYSRKPKALREWEERHGQK